MIRKHDEIEPIVGENRFGGEGKITIRHLLNGEEEMYGKGRLFSHNVMAVGASLGYHVHENECEAFCILKGEAEYDDNGTKYELQAGDVTYTAAGEGHGMRNIGDAPLEYIALIIYK